MAKVRQAGFRYIDTEEGLNCKVASSTASLEEILSIRIGGTRASVSVHL